MGKGLDFCKEFGSNILMGELCFSFNATCGDLMNLQWACSLVFPRICIFERCCRMTRDLLESHL
jgi:hypothetical protein